MSGSSSLVVLLLLAAVVGGLFLFSSPAGEPAPDAVGTATDSVSISPQAAGSSAALWADAGPDRVVGERETVRLDGRGGVSSGTATYLWTASGGLGFFEDATKPNTRYTSPSACDCCQAVTLTLTVTGAFGGTASDSLVLEIRDPIACRSGCPSQDACGGTAVAIPPPCLSATGKSPCPEPDLPCDGPCVSQASTASPCGLAPVPCRCDEGCGSVWESAWPVPVPTVSAAERPTPRIVRQFASRMAEGSATVLRAVVSNPSCTQVCFSWSASAGWFERADTLEPVYHAPQVEFTGADRVSITFTIRDASGRPSYDQIRITIDDVP